MRDLRRKQRTAIRVKGESGKPTTNCAIYGYKKDSNDKYHWLIDEEAAAVVRRIFQLTIEGHGPYEIATMLCEGKIETPATYFARQSRGVWKGREDIPRPYSWNGFAVGQILSKPEYMGHTVNFRTHKESYKDKRAVIHSPEDWLIFLVLIKKMQAGQDRERRRTAASAVCKRFCQRRKPWRRAIHSARAVKSPLGRSAAWRRGAQTERHAGACLSVCLVLTEKM